MKRVKRWLGLGLLFIVLAVVILLAIRLLHSGIATLPSSQPGTKQVEAILVLPVTLFPDSISEPQQVAVTITYPEDLSANPSTSMASQYLPIILTGLFTLLGSVVVLVYNHLAGGSTRKFEWGKYLWDKYEEGYLGLRRTVKETSDADLIDSKLRTLGSKIILPPKLEAGLVDLIAFLRTDEPNERKEQEKQTFLKDFESFVARPWKYL